jgi:hypothetical protein
LDGLLANERLVEALSHSSRDFAWSPGVTNNSHPRNVLASQRVCELFPPSWVRFVDAVESKELMDLFEPMQRLLKSGILE